MKKGVKLFFKTAAIGILSCAVFVAVGYFYLENRLKPVENSTESVPYYSAVPESAGVLLEICGSRTLYYLDFEQKILTVIRSDTEPEGEEIFGYSIDYTVSGDYSLVSGIVDLLGGIDLELDGSALSLTGVQVKELLDTTADSDALKKSIAEKIILKSSENGFKKEDFLYIIENSETDLTVPVCYYWSDYMKELCANARYIG